jgi:predicted dehydrogenase
MEIRTAILGYGRSGSTMHASAIEHHRESFQMAAACDIDPVRRRQAEERFGCVTYDDYQQMLRKERLDLVIIVTRSDQHAQMTCDCLTSGVNVLVTKPWAVNEGEARAMIAAAKQSGKLLLPWLPSRWGCDLRRLRQLFAEKAVGNVFCIRRAVNSFGTRSDWQTERRYGGGYLLNWGPHIVDTPALLAGSEVESVYGRMKQTINPGDVEDCFFATINLANGVLVQAEYSVSVEPLPNWFIQGDRGTIVVREKNLKLYKHVPSRPENPTNAFTMAAQDETVIEETLEGELYGDEKEIYAEVAQAVREEKPYPVTPDDALQLTRVLDAIRLSDAENRVVYL